MIQLGFPKFRINYANIINKRLRLEIDLMMVTRSIGENYCIYIFIERNRLIAGTLKNIDLKAMKCLFISDEDFLDEVVVRPGVYSYLDGYWGERADIVLSTKLKWTETEYVSNLKYKDDHDHCSLCWATISLKENNTYMQSDNKHCLCINCYKNYVLEKDLSFIVIDQI